LKYLVLIDNYFDYGVIPLAILTCPGCGRGGLRVPDGRRGKVTCTRCGAEWFYPETIELNEVEFRCSQTGARFIIQLMRRSPLHKFVVQGIKDATPRPHPSANEERGAVQKSTKAVDNQDTASDQLTSRKPGRWLARLFETVGLPPISSTSMSAATPASNLLSYDAHEYNWTSFLCPYCGASGFIQCATGPLVCDGTIEIRNGRRFYQCFCGSAGFIDGTIKTFEAKQCTIERTDAASSNPVPATSVKAAAPSPLGLPAEKCDKRLLR
jgi:hypothetical protein